MAEPQPNRLDGWKSIADHLGRDPRTAQRWHHERGMPVHHVPGSRGGTVFAFADELDTWLTAGAPAKSPSPLATHTPKSGAVPTQADVTERRRTPYARSAVLLIVAVAAFLLLTGVFGVTRFRMGAAPARVASIEWKVNGTMLSALDANGNALWTFQLAEDRAKVGWQARLERALPVDLNADGNVDVIATVNYIGAQERLAESAKVYHLGTEGNVLWRYRPNRSLTFAGKEFPAPWRVYGAAAGRDNVWISFIHRTWWPSFVVSLGHDGAERLALVNAGHIEALQTVEVGGRELVLAGGFNNEFMLPALAAIAADGPAVVSPQTPGSAFACDNCPTGRPLTYVLFPRSDVNVALGSPFISVADIDRPDDAGSIEVSVRDVPHGTRDVYRLDADLNPQSVGFSDAHWAVHRQLTAAGKLDHGAEDCPARHEGTIVRVWQPGTQWNDVRVGPSFGAKKARQ